METASKPSASATRSATLVIPARLHCPGRPTADRSGRIQMLAADPSAVIPVPLCDRRSQSSRLYFANAVRETARTREPGDGTGRERGAADGSSREAAQAREVLHAAVP